MTVNIGALLMVKYKSFDKNKAKMYQ